MESILISIKKLLGIASDYPQFDTDLIIDINSAIAVLTQIGIGPEEGYAITGETETWSDFIGTDPRLSYVKSYLHLKVKLLFDPPLTSSVMEADNRILAELEWRMLVATDLVETNT